MGRRQRLIKRRKQRKTKGNKNMTNDPIQPLTDDELNDLIKKHDQGGAFKQQVQAAQSCWDAGIVVRKGCSHLKKPVYQVYFTQTADQKIKRLQSYFSSLEWLMYLEGSVDHTEQVIVVEDLVIPDSQFVTGVNVNNVEYSWNEGRKIIGVIHSHHNMGAFFSGTDDAYINQNHDVSIVVSTSQRSPVLGQVRLKAPCNDYVLCEGTNVKFNYPIPVDMTEEMDVFEAEFSPKIKTYQAVQYVGNFYGGSGRGGRGTISYGVRSNSGQSQLQLPLNDPYFVGQDAEDMTDEEVRTELLRYYSDEEVDDFFRFDEARGELSILQDLEESDIHPIPFNTDDDSAWNDVENPDDPMCVDDTDPEFDSVVYGVPLKDTEENVWDLSEEVETDEVIEEAPEEMVTQDEEEPEQKTGSTLH